MRVYVPINFPKDRTYIPVSRKKKRFTFVQCICADGSYLKFFIIIPRKTFNADIYYYYDKDQFVMKFQPKGFMNEVIFQDYFFHHFIIQLQEKRNKLKYIGPSLLIMDNLLCHKKVVNCERNEFYKFIPEFNLHILFIPPHSSHMTQPLDLGIFGNQKLQSQKISEIKQVSKFTNVLNKGIQGMQQACTSRAIVAAFESAGIRRNVIISEDSTINIQLFVDKGSCRAIEHYATVEKIPKILENKRIPVIEIK